jgi:glucose/arabinose dehydrogenase
MRRSIARRTGAAAALSLVLPLASLTTGAPVSAAPSPISPTEWTRTVLTTQVQDPTDLEVAKDGSVVIAERTGAIKVWTQDGKLTTAGRVPVSANVSLTEVGEDNLEEGGIHGLLLDRDFLRTRKVYIRYSVPNSVGKNGEGVFRVSTFTLTKANKLDLRSERKVIDTPAEWAHCCHYGGDMEWKKDGTILMTVGDDTSPRDEGWNPRDKRKGREAFDADRTAQNKRDRRGKVLRFNPDGSVPKDNPHVKNPAYDPYVFAMGFRSDYRMGYDPKTDTTYVGNVGPDARTPDDTRGPQGFDELEVIPRKGGTNHGWPHCIADNKPYKDYDYATGTTKGALSCKGMTPAAIFYDYSYSAEFPLVGSGTRTSMAGPVYRYAGTGALKLPDSFQGKLLHWDWSRSIMWATPVNADGTLDTAGLTPWSVGTPNTFVGIGSAVPAGGPAAPNEVVVGPDGALYVAEYGSGYYQNTNSAISRISCFQCTPSAKDYAGAAVKPVVGTPTGGAGNDADVRAAGTTDVRPLTPSERKSFLAATGGLFGPAALGLLLLAVAVLVRRRARVVPDLSGL